MMRIILTICICLLLNACADDRYTMLNGSTISNKDKYRSDLYDCKMKAINWYNNAPENEDARTNAMLAGAVGGALGGIILDSSSDHKKMQQIMTKKTESCMIVKGYKPLPGNKP